MRNILSTLAVALVTTIAVAAQTAPQTADPQSNRQSTAPNANASITVTGCVEAGPNNTFTLTAPADAAAKEAPTGTTATTPAGSKVAKTISYTLNASKPDDLRPHVGHTVQVTGIEAAPQVTTGSTDKSAGAATQGTTGATGAKPKVETTAQTQIVVRQLTVNAVKMVSPTCSLVK
jgi:hypothetical protein